MSAAVRLFFEALDDQWRRAGHPRVRLSIIGSTALMLRTDWVRGTKDSDVIETAELQATARDALRDIAGKGSPLHQSHRL